MESKIERLYKLSKSAKVGDECKCPSCGKNFIKSNYQQAFCKTKNRTECKDKYWNTVDPKKKCNTTRISPANARYSAYLSVIRDAQRTRPVRFGVWHDDDWNEGDGGSGVTEG